jgi:glutathione S-transferase
MPPRPVLTRLFNLGYRKIPVLAIGHDVYCDTAIICEALEHQFPSSVGYGSLYPRDATGRTNQALLRGFASFWTDRPFFRVTTGLIPGSVWRTSFGDDRAKLIGHRLDPEKLEKKIPQNLSNLDLQLSLFEDLFREADDEWVFWTPTPSLADISIFYQLSWGMDMASGKGIYNLTGGGTPDTAADSGAKSVFNAERYPATWLWFERFKVHMQRLPDVEKVIDDKEAERLLEGIPDTGPKVLPTPAKPHDQLDARGGLVPGAVVSITPDDTGRDEYVFPYPKHVDSCGRMLMRRVISPTIGELMHTTPEEIIITPLAKDGRKPVVSDVRIHFPRLGFVIKPVGQEKL